MLYEISSDGARKMILGARYVERYASELGVLEKDIEDLLSAEPQLLFPGERVLVIAQSIAGRGMADILALDGQGSLVIVEIKRDWSDRTAVAQLLSYAADLRGVSYERLNSEAKRYARWVGGELIERFREFIDDETFEEEKLARQQRIFIVAPSSDSDLRKIVDWLQVYRVPIQFIPFTLLADGQGALRLLSIEGPEDEMHGNEEAHEVEEEWMGHWIFNTNEAYAPGAYERMFDRSVMAIYGYDNGPRNLEGANKGDRVFAYVNRQGIRALGTIEDGTVREGSGIFMDESGVQRPGEYHVQVNWLCRLNEQSAFTNRDAGKLGYPLPVRTVFGRLKRGRIATEIEREIRRRSSIQSES